MRNQGWPPSAAALSLLIISAGMLQTVRGDGSFSSGSFDVSWKRTGDVIEFTMSCQCTGWLSVGWAPPGVTSGHNQADMIVGWVTGTTTTLIDTSSNSRSPPTRDAVQDAKLVSGTEAGGKTTIVFTRPVTPTDAANKALVDGNVLLQWAYHGTQDGTGATYNQHTARGTATVNFLQACAATGPAVLKNPDAALYDNCLALDNTFGVRMRWSVLSNLVRIQMEGNVARATGNSGYVAVGIRDSRFTKFPTNGHDRMGGGTQDFVDLWAASRSTNAGNRCNPFCIDDAYMKFESTAVDAQNLNNRSSLARGNTLIARFDKPTTVNTANDYSINPTSTYWLYYSCHTSNSLGGTQIPRHQTAGTCRGELSIVFSQKSTCSDDYETPGGGTCAPTPVITAPPGGDSGSGDSGGSGGSGGGSGSSGVSGSSFTDKKMTVSWKIVGESLEVTMKAQVTGWVGISISPSRTHSESEMYVGWVTGVDTILKDYYSNSKSQPEVSRNQISKVVSGTQTNGETTIVFTRPLASPDTQHYTISTVSPFSFHVAVGYTDSADGSGTTFPIHDSYATRSVNFVTGASSSLSEGPIGPGLFYTLIVFGIGFIYFIFQLFQRISKRFNKVDFRRVSRASELKLLHAGQVDSDNFLVQVKPKSEGNAFTNFFSRALHCRIPYYQFELEDALIFIGLLTLNIIIIIGAVKIYGYEFGVVTGELTAPNTLIVVLLGTRNSVLSWALHFPFDHAVAYHRWLGRVVFALSIAHFIAYRDLVKEYTTGLISFVALAFLFVTSIGTIRRKFFKAFFYSHFSFVAFIVLGAMHAEFFRRFAIASAVIYGLDRLIRFFYGLIPRKATNIRIVLDTVKIEFAGNWFSQYELGQYVFVSFPRMGCLEFHPFTISSGPDEPSKELVIKSLGDYTSKLRDIAEKKTELWIRVDGPYGKWPFNPLRYRTAVLVAGGVGVTPCVAMLRHIYRFGTDEEGFQPYLQNVFFVWVIKKTEEYSIFQEVLDYCKAKARDDSRFPSLTLFIHVTEGSVEGGFLSGRPDFVKVFDYVEQSMGERRRAAVVSCGPRKMVDNVWDETVKRTNASTRFDFHHETFEF